MNTRANQGGSAIVYGIISVILALAVVGAVYAVQKRADNEATGPMEIASNLNPFSDNGEENTSPNTDNDSSEGQSDVNSNNQAADEEADKQRAAEEKAAKDKQAAEEKKAEEQRQAAAAEAREEREQAAQREQEEAATDDEAQPVAGQQMPPTGGPSQTASSPEQLPQTGPVDYVAGGLALTALTVSIFKFAFSHRYVTGR